MKGRTKDVRILLVGERGVGKTSLILSLVSEEFAEYVPSKAEEITIPADVTPENVPTHIVDSSAAEQSQDELIQEVKRADVVCIVYSVDDETTLEAVTSKWLPFLHDVEKQNSLNVKPVILVGNKCDIVDYSTFDAVMPIMNEYQEVETCIECSARTLKNVSELFYYAQKAVLHPTAPLYNAEEKDLTPKCKKALTRIFMVFDMDNDMVLNDVELNVFQHRCFGASLNPQALDDVRNVVRSQTNDGVKDGGITLKGFLFLHCLFFQRGRHETTWTILRKFGYDDNIELTKEYLVPSNLRIPPGSTAELNSKGLNFFTSIFLKFDRDKDGALSQKEYESFSSMYPETLWKEDLKYVVVTNSKGLVTVSGFLARWVLTTLLNARATCKALAYHGYHTTDESQMTALTITQPKEKDLKRRSTSRNVFKCHVIGPRGAGKSSFCQGLINRSRTDLEGIPPSAYSSYVINTVLVHGTEKYLVLHDIDILNLTDTLSPSQVNCDVACLVYDRTEPKSFEHVAKLYLRYFSETKIPVLIVGSKSDLPLVRQDYLLQPDAFCMKYKLLPPQSFTSIKANKDLYVKLCTMAVFPCFQAAWMLFARVRNNRKLKILQSVSFGSLLKISAFSTAAILISFLLVKHLRQSS
ncbi:hypothetical protein QYM36_008944 [Artemia franciscana]|uniref:Mitochondrial Rho GTPase n=2 Tax=Artemia franciscana TaxID=6661 RepID=A0AA88L6D0_ARTSF|nr:hypothetical protein QYM36_008944 [Artemia franciscana]